MAVPSSTPMRPKPGSFTAGWRRSRPATRPRTFLDPADLHAEKTPQRSFHTCAAIGEPQIRIRAEIFAHRVRRQRRLEFGDRPQHSGGEGVAVRSGPDAVVAKVVVAIGRNRRFDLWD